MGLTVLYKDEHFIVVDKDPDLIVNWANPDRPSLYKQLYEKFPEDAKSCLKYGFYFPHRLDYSTSGVMCVALSKQACAAASNSFQNRSSRKTYVALVRGHVSGNISEINIPIGEDVMESSKMVANGARARSAITRMLVLEKGQYGSKPATKVLLRPLTGRRHQLRVHCHAVGHTIVGDFTYSNREDVDPPRMFLHSLRLDLPNKLKALNIETEDPFQEVPDWLSLEKVHRLCSETMDKLGNYQVH